MTLTLAVLQLLVVAGMAVFLWRQSQKTPSQPSPEPIPDRIAPPATPLPAPDLGVVRKADYEADQSAIQRRFTTLETTMDERHQQLTGLIGSLRRQEKSGNKEELAQLLASQVAAANESRAQPTQGRKLIIRRQA